MASYKQLDKYNWKVRINLGYKDGKKQLLKKQGFQTKENVEKSVIDTLAQRNSSYATTSKINVLL